MSKFEIVSADAHGVVLKLLERKWDASNARELRMSALERVEGRQLVVLDLALLETMDSSGLGALVGVLKGTPPGSRVRLVDVQPAVRRLIELSRLQKVFSVHASVADALAA